MIIRRISKYFRPHLLRFSVALVAMAGVAAMTGASMWLLKNVIDNAILAGDKSMLLNIVIVVVLLFSCKGLLAYTHDYMTAYVGFAIIRKIRDQVFHHVHTLSHDFFTGNDSARIISRLTNDATLLQNALTKIPITIIRDGLIIFILTGYLFSLHWKFALMSFLIIPISGAFIARFGKSLRKTARQGQSKMSDLYTHMQETITGASVVKAFQREDYESDKFKKQNFSYFKIYMKNARVESLSSPVMEIIGVLAISFILWYGGTDVIDGVWTAGGFFTFVAAAISLNQPVKNFSRANATIQQAISGAERIFHILDAKPTVTEKPTASELPQFSDKIEVEKINFSYLKDRPVLKDISLSIPKGTIIALVGSSGSGKTTLASLLLRFYDPGEGAIKIDGKDIRDITLSSLRSQIGLVTQETLLFNDTVRNNISYARLDALDAEIITAAKAANAWEFIKKLPEGLDTLVGERGVLLSGGQKQRLAIARAILKNPPILVLDEATSALDAASEKLVQEAVERLMKNRTVVVIAHRLATVKNAHRIVVLDHGALAEVGTHSELLTQKGIYHRLYELQLLQH